MSEDIALLCKSIPKVELHVHFDGSCQIETLRSIARERKIPFPLDDLEKFSDRVSFAEPTDSLASFLQIFQNAIEIIAGSSNALEMVAHDFCKSIFEAGVVYAEVRFNPSLLTYSSVADDNGRLSNDEVMDAIIKGLHKGQDEFGITVNIIVAFITTMPENAVEMAKLAIRYRNKGVVAVDLAGVETIEKSQQHIDAFKMARDAGLHITVHAGESGPPEHVKEAIVDIGAERIGHGYRILEDEDIYVIAKKKNIHFEMCPWSSIFTGAQKLDSHAIKRFHDDGMNFSINSDDPGIMRKTLVDDYIITLTQIGLSYEGIKTSVFNAVNAAFLSDEDKEILRKKVDNLFNQVEAKFNISSNL